MVLARLSTQFNNNPLKHLFIISARGLKPYLIIYIDLIIYHHMQPCYWFCAYKVYAGDFSSKKGPNCGKSTKNMNIRTFCCSVILFAPTVHMLNLYFLYICYCFLKHMKILNVYKPIDSSIISASCDCHCLCLCLCLCLYLCSTCVCVCMDFSLCTHLLYAIYCETLMIIKNAKCCKTFQQLSKKWMGLFSMKRRTLFKNYVVS